MKLEVARKIIQEQADYLSSMGVQFDYDDYVDEEDIERYWQDTNNGDSISYNVVDIEFALDDYPNIDRDKLYVTQVDNVGGEGCGEEYYVIFKISHPVHGVGYIKYQGSYSSWSGTDWHEPNMVKSKEVMVIQWVDVYEIS